MPAWSEARRAAQVARQSQIKERTNPHRSTSAGWYVFDVNERLCFFCRRKKGRMVTGYLPITGSIWRCAEKHVDEYRKERQWEAERV